MRPFRDVGYSLGSPLVQRLGHLPLEQVIGVRIPRGLPFFFSFSSASQPKNAFYGSLRVESKQCAVQRVPPLAHLFLGLMTTAKLAAHGKVTNGALTFFGGTLEEVRARVRWHCFAILPCVHGQEQFEESLEKNSRVTQSNMQVITCQTAIHPRASEEDQLLSEGCTVHFKDGSDFAATLRFCKTFEQCEGAGGKFKDILIRILRSKNKLQAAK